LAIKVTATDQADIKSASDTLRDFYKGKQIKLLEDKSLMLGGRPAWQFVRWTKDTEKAPGTGTPPKSAVFDHLIFEIVAIDSGHQIIMDFGGILQPYNVELPTAQQVAGTWEWTDASPSTADLNASPAAADSTKTPPVDGLVVIENPVGKFRYSVPARLGTVTTCHGDKALELPDPPLIQGNVTSEGPSTLVIKATAGHHDTLESYASARRGSFAFDQAVIIKDEPVLLDGRAAWHFVARQTTVTSFPVTPPVVVKVNNIWDQTIVVSGDKDIIADYYALENNYALDKPILTQILDSWKWTQPPAGIPANWVLYDNKKFHFKFWAPADWKPTQNGPDGILLAPATLQTSLGGSDGESQFAFVANSCGGANLDATVATQRKISQAQNEKLIEDRAIELAGRPAWFFRIQGGGPTIGNNVYRSYQYVYAIFINNEECFINFDGGESAYNQGLDQAKQIIDSWEWTDAPPTTQPAADHTQASASSGQ
jgi:hypothetical protein